MSDPLNASMLVDLPIRVWLSVQAACMIALNDTEDDPTLERDVGYAHARIDGLIKESPAWAIWEACHALEAEEG